MNKFAEFSPSSPIKAFMPCLFVIALAQHLLRPVDATFRPAAPFRRSGESATHVNCRGGTAAPAKPFRCFSKNRALLVYGTDGKLEVALANYTANLSDEYTRRRRRRAFTVVLSGGYLIDKLRKLPKSPYKESVDWARWHVFWVDERVVKKDSSESNYKLAYDGFLSKVPIPPDQIYSINDSLSAAEGAAGDYEARLKQLVEKKVVEVSASTGFPRFDLMLMGMGSDGHVASLFPGRLPLLREKKRWVAFVKDSPKPPPRRITFTFPVIDASANIAMVVAGSGEVDAVKKALSCTNLSSNPMPVQMVSPQSGKFTWFTDEEAVSKVQDVKCL